MKKILSIIFVAVLATGFVSAQDATTGVTNKKGEAILPVKGDIAIGADALPFLNYLGGMMSLGGSTLDLTATPTTTIYGRYYIADDAAIRLNVSINNTTNVTKTLVGDVVAIAADPLSLATVEDKTINQSRAISVGLGFQKSRGYGRLRGIYGAVLNYTYGKAGIVENTYGNAITATNTLGGVPRILSVNPSSTSTFQLGPVAGVEYYIAPKICIGAEISLLWGITAANTFAETTTEMWDLTLATPAYVKETTKEAESAGSTKTSNSGLLTSGFGSAAGIYVMFHF